MGSQEYHEQQWGQWRAREMEAEDEKAILYGLRPVNLYEPQGKAPLNACPLVPGPPGSVPLEI